METKYGTIGHKYPLVSVVLEKAVKLVCDLALNSSVSLDSGPIPTKKKSY